MYITNVKITFLREFWRRLCEVVTSEQNYLRRKVFRIGLLSISNKYWAAYIRRVSEYGAQLVTRTCIQKLILGLIYCIYFLRSCGVLQTNKYLKQSAANAQDLSYYIYIDGQSYSYIWRLKLFIRRINFFIVKIRQQEMDNNTIL